MATLQEQLAEDRTRWAWSRTVLARERTFAAWMRTGLTAAGAGFIIAKLVEDVRPHWLAIAVGLLFIVAGVMVQGVAFWEFRKMTKQLGKGSAEGAFPLSVVTALTLLVVLGSVGVAVLLLTS